jgi:hypothetical protein
MMRLMLAVLLAATLATGTALAQDTLWTRVYGGPANDYLHPVRQTDDGGYLLAGATESQGAGDWDVYLVRTDESGDTLWTRTYGGSTRDIGSSLAPVSSGGFILAGETTSFGAGDHDVYLLRIDGHGDTLWTRTIGGANYERGSRVIQATDGRLVVCGRTSSFGAGDFDIYLAFVNANGDTTGTHAYGHGQTEIGFAIVEAPDGGFTMAGVTNSIGAGSYDFYLVKTDEQGDVEWERTYGGLGSEWCHDAICTADGGYLIVGATDSWGSGSSDMYLVKTDALGDTVWTRAHGGPVFDGANSVQQTPDGGYIVAGFSGDWTAEWGDLYVVRTDSLGDVLWTETYSRGTLYNLETSGEIRPTADGHYIMAGQCETNGSGVHDAWILKITDSAQTTSVGDSLGNLGKLALSAYPNPFSDLTRISFTVPEPGPVTLVVHNVLGQRVAVLVDGYLQPGRHGAVWDASSLRPGVYLASLSIRGKVSVTKVVLLR